MSTDLLIIFARNPIPGKVKRRLSAEIGEQSAFKVYRALLKRTMELASNSNTDVRLSLDTPSEGDEFFNKFPFKKEVQSEGDMGERMRVEFERAFAQGYRHVCLVGSDILGLQLTDLDLAFSSLRNADAVIGPAFDGGYYLIGINAETRNWKESFLNKSWGKDTVCSMTLQTWKEQGIDWRELPLRRDVDRASDLNEELRRIAESDIF